MTSPLTTYDHPSLHHPIHLFIHPTVHLSSIYLSGAEKFEQLSFLDRLLFSSWPLPHGMQPPRSLVPKRCTPHSHGRFKDDYLAQGQQRPLCIHVTPMIKSMAAIIALPSEGKSAAYLMFNVELRGITSGLKSKYTHGECVNCNFLIRQSFITVFISINNVTICAQHLQLSVFCMKRHVSHIQPASLEYAHSFDASTAIEHNCTRHEKMLLKDRKHCGLHLQEASVNHLHTCIFELHFYLMRRDLPPT